MTSCRVRVTNSLSLFQFPLRCAQADRRMTSLNYRESNMLCNAWLINQLNCSSSIYITLYDLHLNMVKLGMLCIVAQFGNSHTLLTKYSTILCCF